MGSPSFRILGPLEVDGAAALRGPKQRELLVRLALRAGAAVPRERLIDELWGEEPPETAAHAIQVYVSQLRKALPESAPIVTEGTAYRLEVDPDSVDAARFERLLARARASQDPPEVAELLREADSLWRGVPDLPVGDLDRARLEDLRVAALEVRIEAELALGRHNELVSELEAIVREHPLRERLRRHLMLALYRSGRQADAAAAYRDARRVLVEELGLEPSAELRELEAAILRQDESLVVEPFELRERRRLPAPATPLVGRRREVDDLGGLIRGDARLVTLTGPEALARLGSRFRPRTKLRPSSPTAPTSWVSRRFATRSWCSARSPARSVSRRNPARWSHGYASSRRWC